MKQGSYHHGALRTALIDSAVRLVTERGVRDFSLTEASRRLGVTATASYRHFRDRDALLAAVAQRAAESLAAALALIPAQLPVEVRLARCVAEYVRFADQNRRLFEALFAAGLDKSRHPRLRTAQHRAMQALCAPATELCAGDPAAATALARDLTTVAHGSATLLIDGGFGSGPDAPEKAATQAMTLAHITIAARRPPKSSIPGSPAW